MTQHVDEYYLRTPSTAARGPTRTRELGDVGAVDQALHEHVVGLQVAVRQTVGREVAVRVEVTEPARDLPQEFEFGLVREGVGF